jgi:lipoate-protein ligase A
MQYIETGSCKPDVNLAFEEYFLKSKDIGEDIFMLWQDEPAIIVGRFQNIPEEINITAANAHQIQVLRRISGGGAVFHDQGNLCFSFIMRNITPHEVDKSKFIRPIVNALSRLGLQVGISSRNDLLIDEKKFSGSAMALHKDRLLYHGTLLFDTNLEILRELFDVSPNGFLSKGVKSVRSSVTNLKPYLNNMDVFQLKESLKQLILPDGLKLDYIPTIEDLDSIQELREVKYNTWEWNYGNNPKSSIKQSREFPDGMLELYLEIEKGYLKTCRIDGESLGLRHIKEIEQRLTNIRFIYTDILEALDELDTKCDFEPISKDGFLRCIMGF